MPAARAKVEDPCLACRERHSKCDDNRPSCKQCERSGEKCVRVSSNLKFKHGSSGRYDTKFRKEQTWLTQSKNARITFVDQTPELENYYGIDDELDSEASSDNAFNQGTSQAISSSTRTAKRNATTHSSPTIAVEHVAPRYLKTASPTTNAGDPFGNNKKQRTNEYEDVNASYRLPSLPGTPPFPGTPRPPDRTIESPLDTLLSEPGVSGHFETTAVEAEYKRLADSAAATIPSVSSGLLAPEVWKNKFVWPNRFTTTQCACLMRYFVDELAPGLDVADNTHHCTTVVPQRARRCPPLLNAIFTLAAHRLFRMSKYKTTDGTIRYQGINLRELKASTAINYHNASLAYLIQLSADSRHVTDEDLLMAAVILRYHEELDTSVTGEDPETFLHTFQIFTNAQLNADSIASDRSAPVSYTSAYTSEFSSSNVLSSATNDTRSYRHASFRIALRQEITSAFLNQRPVRLSLYAWSSLHAFTEADDTVWTDRLVAFCANVVQFSFGDNAVATAATRNSSHQPRPGHQSRHGRWKELKEFERLWARQAPLSFSPIHYQDPKLETNVASISTSVFPEIWHVSPIQVAGIQYFELARILLTVYDPTIPRLGSGAGAHQKRVSEEVRRIVIKICGIAMSNPTAANPALVVASLAITMCGEYFSNEKTRKAMISLLQKLEVDFGWPTRKARDELTMGWGWN